MIFETQRLLVRKLTPLDLEPFHEMQSDAKVMEFVDGEPKSISEHKEELESLRKQYSKNKSEFLVYAVVQKLDNKFIGTVALVKDNHNENEIGYRLLRDYWNQGFGAELVQGLVKFCKSIKIDSLVAYVAPKNIFSKRILEKSGFHYAGSKESSKDLIFKATL